jgi:small subunit ribosomal protein S4
LDKPHDFKEKRRLKRKFLNHRLLKNFYIVLSYNNFRKYYGLARRKSGSFVGNYLVYLEGRLFMLAYRSNFITNIFLIRHVIKQGIFLINGVVCNQYNYIVKP